MLKNEIRTLLDTIHKDKFKMDYRLKCKTRNCKIIKLLEENRGRTLNDINQSKILYDPEFFISYSNGNKKQK